MERYKFPKILRLNNSKKFREIFQINQSLSMREITLFYQKNFLEYPRIGICISKKVIKKAHERNRVKRIIRESFRLHQHYIKNIDFIIIIKQNFINKNNHYIIKILKILWNNCLFMYYKY
ncbi:MAG: ribonuclease P protein component [Candidatus Dasytiphilus stammeri]